MDPLPGDSDCERFAKEVEKLVAKYPNAIRSQFAKLLYDRFANSGKEFSDDGFKKEFKDGSNQARHYVGGFWAGFTFGETLGRAGANLREDKDRVVVSPSAPIGPTGISLPVPGIIPESKGQTADKALNAVSARHGSNLDKSKIKNADVANLIRTEVCE